MYSVYLTNYIQSIDYIGILKVYFRHGTRMLPSRGTEFQCLETSY